MMWYWGNGTGMGWGGWLVSGLLMIIFWAFVIWAIIALVRYLTAPERQATPSRGHPAAASPEQILAERFARGEIDEEEYTQRLAVLHAQSHQGPSG